MTARIFLFLSVLLLVHLLSCGSKKPTESATDTDQAKPAADAGLSEDQAVISAKTRIKDWLGKDLTGRIAALSKDLAKNVALKLATDKEVAGKAKALSGEIFKDKEVKNQLDKISDKATAGLGNKLTLGWKALQAGGIDAYKQKVREDAQRIAIEVLTEYIQGNVLKDERTAQLLKNFGPALKMQGQIVAVSVEENLSAKVTKKILSIALKISAAGDKAEMADRVESWIERCDEHAKDEVEKLLLEVAELHSIQAAIRGLALDVLTHERTKKELIAMARALVTDSEVHHSLVKVYEAAAFEKGDAQIRSAIVHTLGLKAVDVELFAAMGRLAVAQGAGSMIGRHVAEATEDPEMADLIEDFVMSMLEACGDPTEVG